MKTYIILVSLVMAVSAAEWKLQTKAERSATNAECQRRFEPISDEVRRRFRMEKVIPIEMIPELLCNLRGYGVWSDSEGFIKDRIMVAFDKLNIGQELDREQFRKDFESCQDTQNSSINEWAHRTLNCFVRNRELFEVLRTNRLDTQD